MPTTVELLKASAIASIQADLEAAVAADAQAASDSAGLAAAQAGLAASSASTAVNALALQFKGGIAGTSVPATLPLAGDYYEIISAGFSAASGKTWAVGDKAIYNGTSGQWTQITGYFAPISSAITTLAAFAGGYPNSDGATANRAAGIYGPFDAVNNPREWVAGAASLTIAAVVTVPTSAVGNIQIAVWCQDNQLSTNLKSLQLHVVGSTLELLTYNAGGNYRAAVYSGFRGAYSGQTIFLKAEITKGTSNPVFSVNGVNISGLFTFSADPATPPEWLDTVLQPTYRLVGYNWPAGPAPIVTPILGQTSAADDAFYMQTRKWPAWVVAGGTTTKFNTASFTVGTGTGTLSTNTATSLICSGATSGFNIYSNASQVLIAGQKIRANLTVSGITGAGSVFTTDSIGSGSGGSFGSSIVVLANGTADYDLTVTVSGAFFGRFVFTSTTAASVTVNSFDRIGALSLPSYQPINVVDDVSLLGGNQGRLLGCSPVTDKTNWRISANTWTSGNQQILAGSIIDSTKHIIDQVEQSTTGTPTTTIGSASAGNQYKTSGALAAGINPTTLVTRKLASNDVWVNSNSTAVVRTTITGHIAT